MYLCAMKHIQDASLNGFVILTAKKNNVTFLSKADVNEGDLVSYGHSNGKLMYRKVLSITEKRPQAGKFIDESNRRTHYTAILSEPDSIEEFD